MTDKSIQRMVALQMIVTLIVAALVAMMDWQKGYSFLLGGLSTTLPSAYMAWRLSVRTVVPAVALARLLSAEVGKLLLTGLMIGAVFVWVESLAVGFFFIGLITIYICGLATALGIALSNRGHDLETSEK